MTPSMDFGSFFAGHQDGSLNLSICAIVVGVLFTVVKVWDSLVSSVDQQSIMSVFVVMWKYRNTDFVTFLKNHYKNYAEAQENGDYSKGVCNYYELMSDLITCASGPYWHFVPMHKELSRLQCHEKFHHTVTEFLEAKQTDRVLEVGCGFGEMGRQVAAISGARVTGFTMSDAEIVGGNERIAAAGLQDQCNMMQGDYHNLPMGSETYDKVFGIYCLKYSAQLEKVVSECARVLKPGGKFLSYEIITTDSFDPENKQHAEWVYNICSSTCMPPLHSASAFRAAAEKAGLVLTREEDLCAPDRNVDPWYACFTRTYLNHVLDSQLVQTLVLMAEKVCILPKCFHEFYIHCLVHPASDFVHAGRDGCVTGATMMVWTKK